MAGGLDDRGATVAVGAVGTTRQDPAHMVVVDRSDAAPVLEVLRDIARGGLAGLVVGILLAGIGGRVVMRLAALLEPESAGSLTENGNIIGSITPGGTLALIVFVGLFFGAVAGSLWVVAGPWLPATPRLRALASIPLALALGTSGLVEARNADFAILQRDPVVIASLVVLVGLFGPGLVVAERWLEGRLPHPAVGDTRVVAGYVLVAAFGLLLTFALVVPLYLGSELALAGIALVVVGVATLAAWRLRMMRRPARPPMLQLVARAGLVVATVAGLVVATGEIVGALGLD